jgi:hypothetical protein
MRKRGRVDANQASVVLALRTCGATVQVLSGVGDGCPDLLVGWRGANLLLEVKNGKKPASARTLTEPERKWLQQWKGSAWVVESEAEAVAILRSTIAQVPLMERKDRT